MGSYPSDTVPQLTKHLLEELFTFRILSKKFETLFAFGGKIETHFAYSQKNEKLFAFA